MNPTRLILREIAHRKLGFALALVAVAAAVACVVAALAVLSMHDAETRRRLALHERQTRQQLAAYADDVVKQGELLQDDMRKITKGLGFNVFILPKSQDLESTYERGYSQQTMPEEYVQRLAQTQSITTIEHLLPMLQRDVFWPERGRSGREVRMIGVRGEVPFIWKEQKKALMDPVPEGSIVLGHAVAAEMGAEAGDTIAFRGEPLEVAQVYPERLDRDDYSVWVPLAFAQRVMEEPGRINAILALNCNCADFDMLRGVRGEVASILPETHVILKMDAATARAEARNRAVAQAEASLAAARARGEEAAASLVQHDREVRGLLEMLAAVAVPVALLGAGLWIALSMWSNVRQRRAEIAVLRAIGVRSRTVLAVFLAKAVVVGVVGGAVGLAMGVAGAAAWGEVRGIAWRGELPWPTMLVTVALTPVVCLLAAWLPALAAARQDPASVLSEE